MLQHVGRYKVVRQLGKGAMGVVYLADDPLLNRQVAIKTIDLAIEDASSREFLRSRLLRDARAAASLSHPNIVGIYDVVVEGDCACIVMEYVDGEDLAGYLSRNPVPDSQFTLGIIRAMAAALDYTHSRGIVHRDVKPANVMLDAAGTPKITDFGIARIAEGATKTMTGTVMGTIEYMAPEQIRGEVVDGRADQFALGVVAYRLLTGASLYGDQSMATMTYKIVNEPAPLVRSRNPSLPSRIDPVVARTLAKAPDDRYRNCSEFAEALAASLTGGDLRAAPTITLAPPLPPPPQQPHRRVGAATLVALALAAGAAAGLLIWWKPWARAGQPAPPVVISKTAPEPVPESATAAAAAPASPEPVRKAATAEKPRVEPSPPQLAVAADDADAGDEPATETQAAPADTPRPAMDAFNRGLELLNHRQFAEAVQAFSKAVEIRPNWGAAYINRGNAYQRLSQTDAAVRDYSHAILLNPKLANAYIGRGQAYIQLRQEELAFNDFNQAILLKPAAPIALRGRGAIYLRRKAYRKALADFNESIRLSPGIAIAYRGRAATRRALGDEQGAQADQMKYDQLSARKGEKGG